jgi:hypothetical protein
MYLGATDLCRCSNPFTRLTKGIKVEKLERFPFPLNDPIGEFLTELTAVGYFWSNKSLRAEIFVSFIPANLGFGKWNLSLDALVV